MTSKQNIDHQVILLKPTYKCFFFLCTGTFTLSVNGNLLFIISIHNYIYVTH